MLAIICPIKEAFLIFLMKDIINLFGEGYVDYFWIKFASFRAELRNNLDSLLKAKNHISYSIPLIFFTFLIFFESNKESRRGQKKA